MCYEGSQREICGSRLANRSSMRSSHTCAYISIRGGSITLYFSFSGEHGTLLSSEKCKCTARTGWRKAPRVPPCSGHGHATPPDLLCSVCTVLSQLGSQTTEPFHHLHWHMPPSCHCCSRNCVVYSILSPRGKDDGVEVDGRPSSKPIDENMIVEYKPEW